MVRLPPGVTYGTRRLAAGDTLVGAPDGSSVIDASVPLDDWVDAGDGTWEHPVEPAPHWLRIDPPLIVDDVPVYATLADRYRPVVGALEDGSGYRVDPALYPDLDGRGIARLYFKRGNATGSSAVTLEGDALRFANYRPPNISGLDAVRLQHRDLLRPGQWCYLAADRVVFRTDGPAPTGVRRMSTTRPCLNVHNADGATVRGLTLRNGREGLDLRLSSGVTLRDVTVAECGTGVVTRAVDSLEITGLSVSDCHVGVKFHQGARDVRMTGCRVEGNAADGVMLPPGIEGFTLADSYLAGAREFGHGDCLQQVALARRDHPPARDLNIVGNTFADSAQGLIFDAAEDVRIVGNTFGPRIESTSIIVKGGEWNPNRRFVIAGNAFLAPGLAAIRLTDEPRPLDPPIRPVVVNNTFRVVNKGMVRIPDGTVWENNTVTWSPAVRRSWFVRVGDGPYVPDRSSPSLAPAGVPLAFGRIDFTRIGEATPTELPFENNSGVRAGDTVSVDGFEGRYRVGSVRRGWLTLADPLPGYPVLRGSVWAWERPGLETDG